MAMPPVHPVGRTNDTLTKRPRLGRHIGVATHRMLFREEGERRCDLCDVRLSRDTSDDGGSGLYVWTRGGEVRYEEPPLCRRCGAAVAMAALRSFEGEDDEEG